MKRAVKFIVFVVLLAALCMASYNAGRRAALASARESLHAAAGRPGQSPAKAAEGCAAEEPMEEGEDPEEVSVAGAGIPEPMKLETPEKTPEEMAKAYPPSFAELVAIGGEISRDPKYDDSRSMWKGSPFAWLKVRPSRQVGAIGELLIEKWLTAHGFEITHSADSDADRVVNGHRVEIKLSTLWEAGFYKFQQLRDQNYEAAIWMGVSPHEAHCWVVPKADILRLWKVEGKIGAQHNSGHGGSDTAWIAIDPKNPQEWMAPFGGTLEESLGHLHRLFDEKIEAQ